MKKLLVIILVLIVLTAGSITASDLSFNVSIDWQMSLQGGIRYQLGENIGIMADLGFSLMGLTALDLYLAFDLLPEESPWQVSLLAGIPNFLFPLTFDAAMLSLGGAVQVERSINDNLSLGIRAGEGFPLFFEEGKDMIRDIQFPLDLWPEFAVTLNIYQ